MSEPGYRVGLQENDDVRVAKDAYQQLGAAVTVGRQQRLEIEPAARRLTIRSLNLEDRNPIERPAGLSFLRLERGGAAAGVAEDCGSSRSGSDAEPATAPEALEIARAIPASIAAATRRCKVVSSDPPLKRIAGGVWFSRYAVQPSSPAIALAASDRRSPTVRAIVSLISVRRPSSGTPHSRTTSGMLQLRLLMPQTLRESASLKLPQIRCSIAR